MNKPKLNDYDEEGTQELFKMFEPKTKVITRSVAFKEHYYPFTGYIENFEDYSDLVELLLMANPNDVVRIYISSGGGRLDVADHLVARIYEAQQRDVQVIAELGQTVASAATYIALSCSDLDISPHCEFLVHPWSSGRGWEFAKSQLDGAMYNKKQSDRFMKEVYSGFLSEVEMASVLEFPRDLNFDCDEVAERWENMQQYRKQQFENMLAEVKAKQEALENPTPKPKKTTKKTK